MDKQDKQDKQYDCCVVCGKPTEYRKDVPIDKRERYIEGAGQLCRECFRKLYMSKNVD